MPTTNCMTEKTKQPRPKAAESSINAKRFSSADAFVLEINIIYIFWCMNFSEKYHLGLGDYICIMYSVYGRFVITRNWSLTKNISKWYEPFLQDVGTFLFLQNHL